MKNNTSTALERLQQLVPESPRQQSFWQQFSEMELPHVKHEDWKYTPVAPFYDQAFTAPVKEAGDPQTIEIINQLALKLDDAYRLIFINGQFCVRYSDWIPKITVSQHGSEDALALPDSVNTEAMATLTEAISNESVTIDVPARHVVDKPIYVINLNSGQQGDISTLRVHVRLGQQAEACLVEHHVAQSDAQGVTLSRITFDCQDAAHLEHIKVIEQASHQQHYAHNDMRAARDANAKSTTLLLNAQIARHQTSSILTGNNGEVNMNSLALPVEDKVFDTRTFLRHQSPHCQSYQLHKVISNDKATGVFDGMIYVDVGAEKTDGQMDNHNLLLSDNASVNSKPKLEIYTDDVKCSHGATTGQLDKDQIFYLQARGIPKAQAEKIITFAFAAEVTETIGNDVIKSLLSQKVEQYLAEQL
ncbi:MULTISPECIES: Fe-S cluster assembly protein SufD [unclassified Vibrio]|uniref:Fe-S cluster assembly protein SufD n=1 Tax=Vibrio sp. HB236076 TaxID=3232307 RepID=A0AB39HBC6_9VIBR|nr:Fe-S cluster assembly protein SufD [Vibrio sp. HB161653]MDP5253437.1 Fe-S cluster assembly protein SufD [Vibrio sp. HB161653]